MRSLAVGLAVAVAALVAATLAQADGGPLLVTQGGSGVASSDGSAHWVTLSVGPRTTLLEKIERGQVNYWLQLRGLWGTPTLGAGAPNGQGLSHDGRTLVLESLYGPSATQSRFLVVNLTRMRVERRITLLGQFSFDALSPDATRLYLIEYTSSGDLTHYIVRGYDMRTRRLIPGKIADRSEHEKSMAGTPVTRTTSADGRWVYTLYRKPSGESFIHALDTVGAAAYCIDLPRNRDLSNIVLSLRKGGRTLAAHSKSGQPWLNIAVGSWRISYPGGVPWTWVGTGAGGGLSLLLAGGLVLRRRRGEELEEHVGQELGLA
jgi:hypothetical protein